MTGHEHPTAAADLHHGVADDSPERGKHDKEGRQRALMQAATAVFAST